MRLISCILFLSIIQYPLRVQCQTDSLEKDFHKAKKISDKIKIANELAISYQGTAPEKALKWARLELKLSQKRNVKIGIGDAYHQIGNHYYYAQSFDSALNYYNQSIKLKLQIKDTLGLIDSYGNSGAVYLFTSKYDLALKYFNLGLELELKLKKFDEAGSTLSNMSAVFKDLGDLPQAIQYCLKAVQIFEQSGNKIYIAYSYGNLGHMYNILRKHSISINYFNKCIQLFKEQKDTLHLINAYIQKGNTILDSGLTQQAIEIYEKTLILIKLVKSKNDEATLYLNLGIAFEKNNELDRAIEMQFKAIALYEETSNREAMATCYSNLAYFMKIQKKYALGISYANLARKMAIDGKLLSLNRDISSHLSDLYEGKNDFRNAFYEQKLYFELNDSLMSEDNLSAIARTEVKYSMGKKALADSIQNAEIRKLKEAELKLKNAELKQEKLQQYYLWSGLTLTLLLGIFIFNRFRITKKQKIVIEEQKIKVMHAYEELGEKNKEILDSITYAKRLQDAILPPLKLVKEYLPNSFVLYQPKDIVAGDFYFMEPLNGKIVFAAADCTGHGVPGAMVSVVCSNALKRAVKEFRLNKTGDILNKVRELILETFEKSESDVKDGMDISLCIYDYSSKILLWSGANNPIWLIKKNNTHLEEIKPDKQPVGKSPIQRPFTTQEILIEDGDTFYIFTDGFEDQFGGEKGKKFKSSKMKEMILSIQPMEMDQQQIYIKNIFEDWKGNLEQVDDVCIIGVRV